MFHSSEQWTLSSKMEWFKFMMCTPWSSCEPCLCFWLSDSHDLVSLKNAPSQQTSVLFFPASIPNTQFSPVYYHMVALSFDALLSFDSRTSSWEAQAITYSSHASKGNARSISSVNETWGEAWEGQASPYLYPLFLISSHLGSGILTYMCVCICELF